MDRAIFNVFDLPLILTISIGLILVSILLIGRTTTRRHVFLAFYLFVQSFIELEKIIFWSAPLHKLFEMWIPVIFVLQKLASLLVPALLYLYIEASVTNNRSSTHARGLLFASAFLGSVVIIWTVQGLGFNEELYDLSKYHFIFFHPSFIFFLCCKYGLFLALAFICTGKSINLDSESYVVIIGAAIIYVFEFIADGLALMAIYRPIVSILGVTHNCLVFIYFCFVLAYMVKQYYLRKYRRSKIYSEIAFFIRRHRENIIADRQTFEETRDNLLLLEWALMQLMHLSSLARPKAAKLLSHNYDLSPLYEVSSGLFRMTTRVIASTEIRTDVRTLKCEPVSLHMLMLNVNFLLEAAGHPGLEADPSTDITITGDYLLLTQLLYKVCAAAYPAQAHGRRIRINVQPFPSGDVALVMTGDLGEENPDSTDFLLLKDAYSNARHLNISLGRHTDAEYFLAIPATMVVGVVSPSVDVLALSHSELSGPTVSKDVATQDIANDFIEFSTHFSALNVLANVDFNVRDTGEMLEKACELFLGMTAKRLRINISQGEQLVLATGNTEMVSKDGFAKIIENNDIHIAIHSDQPIEKRALEFFELLIGHIQIVRGALKGLARNPAPLSELQELSSKRDRIVCLKADVGYTAVYYNNRREPKHLTLRLRSIKYFFDDEWFLQVHRSWLVNPRKVERVEVSPTKSEAIVGNMQVPLSRSYIQRIRKIHPEWFS